MSSSSPTVEKKTSCPKVFASEVLRLAPKLPRNRNHTLPFDETDHLRYRVFGRDAQTHVNMICHQMAFNNLTTFLLRQLMKHPNQVPPYLPKQLLTPPLGDEHYVVFAIPFGMAQTLILSHSRFSGLLTKSLRISLTAL
jgi:hypothetical protein